MKLISFNLLKRNLFLFEAVILFAAIFIAIPLDVSAFSISGNIGSICGGATVALSGTSAGTASSDASGNYTFSNLANGTYTVKANCGIRGTLPSSQTVTIKDANVVGINFKAAHCIKGAVTMSSGFGISGATVALSGASAQTTITDSQGNYSICSLDNGSYSVTPSKTGYTLSPLSKAVSISDGDKTGVNFTAGTGYSINGTIQPNEKYSISGVTITIIGDNGISKTTTTDTNGNYTVGGLLSGTYTVTPSKSGAVFYPANRTVIISGSNISGVNF